MDCAKRKEKKKKKKKKEAWTFWSEFECFSVTSYFQYRNRIDKYVGKIQIQVETFRFLFLFCFLSASFNSIDRSLSFVLPSVLLASVVNTYYTTFTTRFYYILLLKFLLKTNFTVCYNLQVIPKLLNILLITKTMQLVRTMEAYLAGIYCFILSLY